MSFVQLSDEERQKRRERHARAAMARREVLRQKRSLQRNYNTIRAATAVVEERRSQSLTAESDRETDNENEKEPSSASSSDSRSSAAAAATGSQSAWLKERNEFDSAHGHRTGSLKSESDAATATATSDILGTGAKLVVKRLRNAVADARPTNAVVVDRGEDYGYEQECATSSGSSSTTATTTTSTSDSLSTGVGVGDLQRRKTISVKALFSARPASAPSQTAVAEANRAQSLPSPSSSSYIGADDFLFNEPLLRRLGEKKAAVVAVASPRTSPMSAENASSPATGRDQEEPSMTVSNAFGGYQQQAAATQAQTMRQDRPHSAAAAAAARRCGEVLSLSTQRKSVRSASRHNGLSGLLVNRSFAAHTQTGRATTPTAETARAAAAGRRTRPKTAGSNIGQQRQTSKRQTQGLAERIRQVCRLHKQRLNSTQNSVQAADVDRSCSLSIVGGRSIRAEGVQHATSSRGVIASARAQAPPATREQTDFVKAILQGDAMQVQQRICETEPNTQEREHLLDCVVRMHGGMATTPLKAATRQGQEDIMRLLLEAKANPDCTVGGGFNSAAAGWTRPIHDAPTAPLAQLLVDFGAVKWSADPREPDLLQHHRRHGRLDVVGVLLQDPGDRRMHEMHRAAQQQRRHFDGGSGGGRVNRPRGEIDRVRRNLPMSVKEVIAALGFYLLPMPPNSHTSGSSPIANKYQLSHQEQGMQCAICLTSLDQSPAMEDSPRRNNGTVGASAPQCGRSFTELILSKLDEKAHDTSSQGIIMLKADDGPALHQTGPGGQQHVRVVRIGCGHLFHLQCIVACWKWSCLCPYCRHDCRLHLRSLLDAERHKNKQAATTGSGTRRKLSSRSRTARPGQRHRPSSAPTWRDGRSADVAAAPLMHNQKKKSSKSRPARAASQRHAKVKVKAKAKMKAKAKAKTPTDAVAVGGHDEQQMQEQTSTILMH